MEKAVGGERAGERPANDTKPEERSDAEGESYGESVRL